MTHTLTIINGAVTMTRHVEDGANLRRALLDAGQSPYVTLTQRLNCGGRGLCATCGVWIEAGEPAPTQWHDRAAAAWGYPRLSCQISIHHDMTVRILPDKVIWGGRDVTRRWQPHTPTPPAQSKAGPTKSE